MLSRYGVLTATKKTTSSQAKRFWKTAYPLQERVSDKQGDQLKKIEIRKTKS